MNQLTLGWIAGIALSIATLNKAHAIEALSTQELIEHCAYYDSEPDSSDGVFCIRYIQGFIDGAVATDERVTFNVAEEYERAETVTERATRTRLGAQIRRYGPSYYAEFCLGEPVSLESVVKSVFNHLSTLVNVPEQSLARDVVYSVLRKQYPCATDP